MKIVLTNDDGYGAPGLEGLLRLCEPLGECVVVAPSHPQSGVAHAVTTGSPLAVERRGPQRFAVEGTPADCARVALAWVAPDADWVISGINHGANLGADTYISGTVAAAREAALMGRSALALSQYAARHRRIDWEAALRRARPALEELLERGAPPQGFWNVNLPHPADEATACEMVECALDSSPHGVRFEHADGRLHWRGDYHQRPRRAGHDVDVCFSGRIAVTAIGLGISHDPAPRDTQREEAPARR